MIKIRNALLAFAVLAAASIVYFSAPAVAGLVAPSAQITTAAAVGGDTGLVATTQAKDTETAVVKVSRGGGHGSGVHIGDGYILTARHVVENAKMVSVNAKDGKIKAAEVLWANATYDIALLKVKEPVIGSAHLDCRTAAVGTEIIAMGSPMTIDFVSAFGRIAGEPRKVMGLKSVFVTDITTVMGMSGGPVFDRQDNLIGITVAVMTAPLPSGPSRYSPSLVGFGFVVPSSAVCDLMARGEV